MKITVLIENTKINSRGLNFQSEHGVSLFIETGNKKILFDTGSSKKFIKNAEKLGKDISDIDYVIISHAHGDHGGGLKYFFAGNTKATVFLHKDAAYPYYTNLFGKIKYYIGLDDKILKKHRDRIQYIVKDYQIAEGISILTDIQKTYPMPRENRSLFRKIQGRYEPDNFSHEIILTITEKNQQNIFTGCAHSGIINMLEKAANNNPDSIPGLVTGGFHLFNPATAKNESEGYIKNLVKALKMYKYRFYAGHCTGKKNYKVLKQNLGDQLHPFKTGMIIST